MLSLILTDVQYSQKAVISFENASNGQNHSSLGFHHPGKNPPSKISHPPHLGGNFPIHPLTLFRKPWFTWPQDLQLNWHPYDYCLNPLPVTLRMFNSQMFISMFSGGIELEHCLKMGLTHGNYYLQLPKLGKSDVGQAFEIKWSSFKQ